MAFYKIGSGIIFSWRKNHLIKCGDTVIYRVVETGFIGISKKSYRIFSKHYASEFIELKLRGIKLQNISYDPSFFSIWLPALNSLTGTPIIYRDFVRLYFIL